MNYSNRLVALKTTFRRRLPNFTLCGARRLVGQASHAAGTEDANQPGDFSHLRTGHIDGIQRHIFLCCDQSNPKCCSLDEGLRSWDFLKKRLRDLGVVGVNAPQRPQSGEHSGKGMNAPGFVPKVMRTKADCVQVCRDGPIAVVYPEGSWYAKCTPEVLEQIIQSHIIGGKEYKPNLFKTQPLKK